MAVKNELRSVGAMHGRLNHMLLPVMLKRSNSVKA
jgi:hypothetical protein